QRTDPPGKGVPAPPRDGRSVARRVGARKAHAQARPRSGRQSVDGLEAEQERRLAAGSRHNTNGAADWLPRCRFAQARPLPGTLQAIALQDVALHVAHWTSVPRHDVFLALEIRPRDYHKLTINRAIETDILELCDQHVRIGRRRR